MRFLTPVLFFAAAGYVHWFNTSQSQEVLQFPFIDILYPASAGDHVMQGKASVVLLAAVGLLSLLWQISASWRYRRHLRRNLEKK